MDVAPKNITGEGANGGGIERVDKGENIGCSKEKKKGLDIVTLHSPTYFFSLQLVSLFCFIL